jgi:hypothetical protein
MKNQVEMKWKGGIPINRPPKPDGQIVRSITPIDQLV